MFGTIHHVLFMWDFSMTNPHRKDWLGWQGQTPGKQHRLSWDSQGTQFGGKGCPGLCPTNGTTAGAMLAGGGIWVPVPKV
jgi:hypothetical protein